MPRSPEGEPYAHARRSLVLRLQRAQREHVTPVPLYLDALLPDDHLARLIWAAVERLDLSAFAAEIKVVEGEPGRAAADPAVLVALWIYATSQGEHRARGLPVYAPRCAGRCIHPTPVLLSVHHHGTRSMRRPGQRVQASCRTPRTEATGAVARSFWRADEPHGQHR